MSKWHEKRTPEEQKALDDFNAQLRKNDYYGDYDLEGYAYAPRKLTDADRKAQKELAILEGFERQSGFRVPSVLKPKVGEYDPYMDYQAGGQWRGYQAYRPATLDYRYIEQMANALASKHQVSVKVGDGWAIDLNAKELTYNPMTLMTGSKAQMIASLLHEIGHLRHTTPVEKLKTNQEYGKAGHEILNLYEDFRIDDIMADSYSGAESVYRANLPMIEDIAREYGKTEKAYRENLVRFLAEYHAKLNVRKADVVGFSVRSLPEIERANKEKMALEQANHKKALAMPSGTLEEKRNRRNTLSRATRHMTYIKRDMARIGQAYDAIFDEMNLKGADRTVAVARKRLQDAITLAENGETIFGFEALVICEAYGANPVGKVSKGMKERLEKCRPAIEGARNASSTQDVVHVLNKDVYPHIKDLLMNFQNGENLANGIGKGLAKKASEYADRASGGAGKQESRQEQGGSGTGAEIPKEWADGNYQALKQSVQTAINDLVQRLRFMRATDTSNKYETNLKRGKLHGKHLYRLATGNDRLFRRKTEQKDRIGQVGITVIIDKSGSMYGNGGNMIHTVRGAIILAETCHALDIPLEIMTFSGTNKTLKEHDEPYTKAVQERLAGLTRAEGGSSNLYTSLDKTGINKLKKRNKVAVILSDGGVGGGNYKTGKRYSQYFAEMRKANVVPVGVGIGCGDEITKLVGAGESTDNAYDLPAIFDRIMRGCVNRTLK